jgi:hypothetical protein
MMMAQQLFRWLVRQNMLIGVAHLGLAGGPPGFAKTMGAGQDGAGCRPGLS